MIKGWGLSPRGMPVPEAAPGNAQAVLIVEGAR